MVNKCVIAIFIILVVTLSGCAAFTKQSDTITVERKEFLNAYARAKVSYMKAVMVATRACETGQWPRVECQKAQAIHEQVKQLVSEIDAKLAVPESSIDWPRVMRVLEAALGILL